jgi:hypothetical protein
MYRSFSCCLIILFLNGCAAVNSGRLSEIFAADTADSVESGDQTSFEPERQALFDQPYIDPLTDYLIEYYADADRRSVLQQVRDERDRRCEEVATGFAAEPSTREALQRFNAGYAYSCPEQVAVFEERVNREAARSLPEPSELPDPPSAPETVKTPEPKPQTVSTKIIPDQALSDCYLLTTIRNFSAARQACREPANLGDVRSQANMAVVAHAFEDYEEALKWAQKAASESDEAAFLLGQMYANGRGVSQNKNQAVYWFKEAARKSHKEAKTVLDQYREGALGGKT